MLFALFSLLVGRMRITSRGALLLANLLDKAPCSLFGFQIEQDRAVFYCLAFHKKALFAFFQEKGVSVESVTLEGLPAFFWRYRLRFGALLGAVFAIFLTVASSRFIWRIDVVGNTVMSDSEVLKVLAAEGVYEGAYIGSIDALAVANRVAMKSDRIAWMAVNIVGNTVEAVVAEYSDKEMLQKDKMPSNVVAKKSGVIHRIETESGVAVVKKGTVVNEGALLISGVNRLRDESYLYQPAKGKVFAETLNEVTVEKTLQTQKKVYTGEVFCEKSYIFFTKSKKVSQDSGNLPPTCDRIETKERIMLFGKIALPVWTVRVEYRAFVLVEETLTEEEAKQQAYEEAWQSVLAGELLSAEDSYSFDGLTARVTLRYRIIEDIAKDLPLFETP